MAIQGLRTTANFVTNQRPENWREGILLLNPNGKMPLFALTSMMKKQSSDDPKFHWWEKVLDDRRVALHATSGDLTTTNTTITLTSDGGAKLYKTGDILLVEETGEKVRVAADPTSDTSLVVERGFAGTTAATVDANGSGVNPNLLCVGSVFEEGSDAPSGVGRDPTERWNNCQIFRDSLEATRTAMKTRLRTGDAVKEAKRECLEYHGIDIERSLWFGTRWSGTQNGKPARMMGGLQYWLETYGDADRIADESAGGTTMADLEEYLYLMFLYGSSQKMAFCGNRALLTLQQIIRKNTQWQFTGDKEFGMDVQKLTCPFGELVLKTHPLFNQNRGGTNTTAYYGHESWLFALDMANLKYRYVDDTFYEAEQQDNGLDGKKSGYTTECALEIHHPNSHFLIKNLVSGAADS